MAESTTLHIGDVLQDTVLSDMTVTEFAKRLNVSRVVTAARAGACCPELAIRLAAALEPCRLMAAHAGRVRLQQRY